MRDTMADNEELRSRKRARYEDDHSTQSTQQSISMDASVDPASQPLDQPPHPRRTTILPSSFPSSDKLPHPASLETVPETSPQPLPIPKSTPETAKAKRNEIRRAWHFLHAERSDHPEIDLGSLPSSWPTAEEDEFHVQHTGSSATEEETHTPTQDDMYADHNDDNDNEDDIDIPSQATNTLSLSSSAFASQDQGHLQQDSPGDVDIPPEESSEKDPGQPRSLKRSSSSRARRAAYLAARADSYDAWVSMGLVSAGDNHSIEEAEL
jgi:DNA cross-link repair 1C protein